MPNLHYYHLQVKHAYSETYMYDLLEANTDQEAVALIRDRMRCLITQEIKCDLRAGHCRFYKLFGFIRCKINR